MVTFQTSYINLHFNFSRSFENWNKTLPVQKKLGVCRPLANQSKIQEKLGRRYNYVYTA